MKKIFSILILAVIAVSACNTDPQATEVFITDDGAINGYDPVAYFRENKPVKGSDQFHYDWKGTKWYFFSADNLTLFKTSPEKFAPQYGGFCAYGTAEGEGHKATTEPDAWTIVNDKLYLNYNLDVKSLWLKNRDEFIRQADANWPKVKLEKF